MSTIQDDSITLKQELNKVEDYLTSARAERDDLINKYNALNDRVCIILVFYFKGISYFIKYLTEYFVILAQEALRGCLNLNTISVTL